MGDVTTISVVTVNVEEAGVVDDSVTYINDPDDINYPVSATACTQEGSPFTHIVDNRDGKKYAVTLAASRCWFAQNLEYTGNGCLTESWDSSLDNPYPTACREHGPYEGGNQGAYMAGIDGEILYQWGAAMNGATTEGSRGVCPYGWRIPSYTELNAVVSFVGAQPSTKLRALEPYSNGTDTIGFKHIPTGMRDGT